MYIYLVYEEVPNGIMHRIQALSKHEALKKYNEEHGTNYRFIKKDFVPSVCVVKEIDYYRYNFSKFSYAYQKVSA